MHGDLHGHHEASARVADDVVLLEGVLSSSAIRGKLARTMRATVIAPLAALVLFGVGAAREARAEETVTQDAVSQDTASPVRVHVRLDRARDVADVLVERRGSWTVVCQAPCTFDGNPGEQVRIDMGDILDAPLTFNVVTDGKSEQDIVVVRRGNGLFVGGLVAIGVGAISLALGAAILRGAGADDLFGDAGTNKFMGRLAALLGAGSVIAGTTLIVRRSTTPFLVPSHPPPTQPVGVSQTHFAPPQIVWTVRF